MRRKFLLSLLVAAMVFAGSGVAAGDGPTDLKRAAVAADAPPGAFGNDVFQVRVRPAGGTGVGQFTVLTGAGNPAGAGQDVLYGQGAAGTSYLILRDLTAGIDYVQGQMLTHTGEVSLDDKSNFQQLSDRSSTTYWAAAGNLTVIQEVSVTGTTAADSRVVVKTEVEDSHSPPHQYRVQYLWDTAIGLDDGPVVQPRTGSSPYAPFDPVIGVEQTFDRPAGDLVVVDNDVNSTVPGLAVALSAKDSDVAKYVCWPDAIFAPFGGYVTDNTRNISGPASNCLGQNGRADSAAQYLWSLDPATGTTAATASLRMSPPVAYPSTMKAGPISLGSATAKLTDTATGLPLAGRAIAFSSGGQVRCTKTTDAAGKATCGGLLGGLLGYDVTYAGGAIWAASTDHGGLGLDQPS